MVEGECLGELDGGRTIFFVFTGLLLELVHKPLDCVLTELVRLSLGIALELNLLEMVGSSVDCTVFGCALGGADIL
jgi:hypothetical protein